MVAQISAKAGKLLMRRAAKGRAALFGESRVSDTNPDLAAQEVDEELRRDQLNALWKAYGKYVIGGAIGVVLAVGGSQLYDYLVRSDQEASSKEFAAAVTSSADADSETSISIWENASGELNPGYSAMAKIRAGQTMAKAGKLTDAVAVYDSVAANVEFDTVLREFSSYLAAIAVLDQGEDILDARARFGALSTKGQPWYFNASEQLAYIDMKEGATQAAYDIFSLLAEDSDTPQSIAVRARQFRDMLETQLPMETEEGASEEPLGAGETNDGQ
jgi:hypothetical protein